MKRKNLISRTAICLYLVLAVVITSCTHRRNGEIVMDKEGNYYELRAVESGNESYALDLIDTTKYKVVGFNNR
jgi:hypothetical protein